MKEKLGKFKWVIFPIVIIVIILAGYFLADKIVGASYSAEDFISNKNKENESEQLMVEVDNTEDVFEMEFGTEVDYETGIGNVSVMYDSEGIEEKQREFLQDEYEKYERILLDIEENYEGYLDMVPLGTGVVEGKDEKSLYIDGDSQFTIEDIFEYDYVQFKDCLTVIGLYGDTCALLAYNYPEGNKQFLIFVDFSEASFVLDDSKNSWNIGDVRTISLLPSEVYKTVVGDYKVIFARE